MPAVIFDQDGTLVDLFELHLKGFQAVLGSDFKRDDLAALYGKTGEEIIELYLSRKGLVGDVGALAERRRRWVVGNIHHCTVLPGVNRLLPELKGAGFSMAVGTSNTPELAEAILKACCLDGFFSCVSCRNSRLRGKPSPDIFLAAAKELGVEPEDCVVVEDSTFGVRAAKAAGMKVIAVATGKHKRKELADERPDILVDTLQDVDASSIRSLFK
jgi:beta-phosphoglucomutase-like phosphatase (HAD superfamily)